MELQVDACSGTGQGEARGDGQSRGGADRSGRAGRAAAGRGGGGGAAGPAGGGAFAASGGARDDLSGHPVRVLCFYDGESLMYDTSTKLEDDLRQRRKEAARVLSPLMQTGVQAYLVQNFTYG